MPTNILRNRSIKAPARQAKSEADARRPPRRILIRAGRVSIHIKLLDTKTADRVWLALPIHSTAETWGRAIHFETPVETGRERGARSISEAGDICFWSEDDRVIIGFGPTPLSRAGEIRLPRPCNVWAKAEDDVALLKAVVPGEKVSMTAA